jgi:hypothetical protein
LDRGGESTTPAIPVARSVSREWRIVVDPWFAAKSQPDRYETARGASKQQFLRAGQPPKNLELVEQIRRI